MDELTRAIESYILDQRSDYAIMLSGPWGSGKSYLWRNHLEPRIKRLPGAGEDRAIILYVSLFGLSEYSEIVNAVASQLALQFWPVKQPAKSRFTTVAKNLAKLASNYANLSEYTRGCNAADLLDLLPEKKHAVVCFDDLERSSLPIKQVFGCINQFVEKKTDAKVILICNEEEISEKEDYKRYKEKLVQTTLRIPPLDDSSLRIFIRNYAGIGPQKAFIEKHLDLITALFRRSETSNLRLLRFSLVNLQQAVTECLAVEFEPGDALVRTVLPAAIEFHRGRLSSEQVASVIDDAPAGLFGLGATQSTSSPEIDFYRKYHPDYYTKEFLRFDAFAALIITGCVDREQLKEDIALHQLEAMQKHSAIERLNGPVDTLEDEEFAELLRLALSEFEEGSWSIRRLLKAVQQIDYAISLGWTALQDADLRGALSKGISKFAERGHFPFPWDVLRVLDEEIAVDPSNTTQWLKQKLVETNRKFLVESRRRQFVSGLNDINAHPGAFVEYLLDRQDGVGGVALRDLCTENELIEQIERSSNEALCYLHNCITDRYRHADKELLRDKDFLKNLGNAIGGTINSIPGEQRLKRYHLTCLRSRLDDVGEQLNVQDRTAISSTESASTENGSD